MNFLTSKDDKKFLCQLCDKEFKLDQLEAHMRSDFHKNKENLLRGRKTQARAHQTDPEEILRHAEALQHAAQARNDGDAMDVDVPEAQDADVPAENAYMDWFPATKTWNFAFSIDNDFQGKSKEADLGYARLLWSINRVGDRIESKFYLSSSLRRWKANVHITELVKIDNCVIHHHSMFQTVLLSFQHSMLTLILVKTHELDADHREIALSSVPFQHHRFCFTGVLSLIEPMDTEVDEDNVDLGRNNAGDPKKMGRPPVDRQQLGNLTNRVILGWITENYGKALTWNVFASLFGLLKSDFFDLDDLAPSVYLLRQAEPLFVPETQQKTITLSSNRKVWYFDPEDICRLFLSSEDLARDLVQKPKEGDVVDECACGTGFRRYYEEKLKRDPRQEMLLLLLLLFADGYRQMTCRGKQIYGLEIAIANANPEVRSCKAKSENGFSTDVMPRRFLKSEVQDTC